MSDDVLAGLLRLVDGTVSLGIPITLGVGGLLVSGRTISRVTYVKLLADELVTGLEKALGEEQTDKMRESLAGSITSAQPVGPAAFVHLREVQIFHPGGSPIPAKASPSVFRVKLEAVDFFFLGCLNAS